MKIKKYNEIYSQDEDYEEEDESDLQIVGWRDYENYWKEDGTFYILDYWVDHNHAMLYDGFVHQTGVYTYTPLTDKEMKDHIYNNETKVLVYNKKKGNFDRYYWKDLPKEIKNQL